MNHCLNLKKIAAQVHPDKIKGNTFYHRLIGALRGGDMLSSHEIDQAVKVIGNETEKVVNHLKALKTAKPKIKPVKN
jgi:hypothetical protein